MKKVLQSTFLLLVQLSFSPLWGYTDITSDEVHNRLAEGDTLIILDVREVFEYTTGHIAEPTGQLPLTPVNIPWVSNVLIEEFQRLPLDIDIIVYCQSGGRSALASAFLESRGFTQIYNMVGGIAGWSYETRDDLYGDNSGLWVSPGNLNPITIICTETGDTSKIIFPSHALPGADSIYIEFHFASHFPFLPPNVPESDVDGLFSMTVLDPFGLSLFIGDSLVLTDSVNIFLSPEYQGSEIFNPDMKVFVPDEGWRSVSFLLNHLSFFRAEIILRKWYNVEGYLPTSIYSNKNETPSEYTLHQNFPNPFNPSTRIKFTISDLPTGRQGLRFTILKVYDVLGNEVATLVNEELPAGEHEVKFNSDGFTSGIYFYKLQANEFAQVKKMMLLK